jgi:hypothetical protein
VFGSGLKDWVACSDQLAKISQQNIKIGRDRLEQLCNRAHDSSLIRRV